MYYSSKFVNGKINEQLSKVELEVKILEHDRKTQELLRRQAEIVKNKEIPQLEKRFYIDKGPKYEFVCRNCGETGIIDSDQLDEQEVVLTPIHCGVSMSIKLVL